MDYYDYAVIGAGSAGVRSARIAASLGAKTVLFESKYLGGTCVNVGCIPKKLFSYASSFSHDYHIARSFGWSSEVPKFNFKELIDNKNKEISRLNQVYEKNLLNQGVEIVRGQCSFIDHQTLKVEGRQFQAKKILIATGGKPVRPDIPGSEHALLSDDVFSLTELPRVITIVGGGYIAVEMASIFIGLGVKCRLVYRGKPLLRNFDMDIRNFVSEELNKKGVEILFDSNVESIEKQGGGFILSMNDGTRLATDHILYATGREPNYDGLELKNSDVKLNSKNKVVVDNQFRTNIDNIYAAGDICSSIELTPTAIKQGEFIARNLFDTKKNHLDFNHVPTAVFTNPPVATVGLTEEQASEKYETETYRSTFRPLKYTLSNDTEKSMMKLVVEKQTQKVLGIHMVGLYAPEIIQGFAVALNMGLKKSDLDNTVGVHPSSAEEFVTMR